MSKLTSNVLLRVIVSDYEGRGFNMRIIVLVFLLGLMQPVLAITKCEHKGKVLYKRGTCPENSSTKILVKNKFVSEDYLQQHQQKRVTQSEKAFIDMNTPRKRLDDDVFLESESPSPIPEKVKMSNETTHFQLQKVDNDKEKEGKINVPGMYDGVNVKLSEMERELEQRNKELKQLQQQ